MSDANEMVKVEIDKEHRVRIRHAVISQMVRLGLLDTRFSIGLSWESLDLGFEVPAGWPDDEGSKITLSQLIVIAKKLKMRIHIRELEMTPL